MFDKKYNNFKTPDLSKMQEVVIDARTKIYIDTNADPIEAKTRYLERIDAKNKIHLAVRKPIAS